MPHIHLLYLYPYIYIHSISTDVSIVFRNSYCKHRLDLEADAVIVFRLSCVVLILSSQTLCITSD